MMEKTESTTFYLCDYPDCKNKSWLGNGFDWKMCEIVLGIHPEILKGIKKPILIQKKFHFCRDHYKMKDNLYIIISEEFPGPIKDICTHRYLEEKLGCWITIHDCLNLGEFIKNFQLTYSLFERIINRFCFVLEWAKESSNLHRRMNSLKNPFSP
jgi:hypothetical protein